MIVITLECPFLSIEKKETLAREFTDTASKIIGIAGDDVIIFFREDPNENMAQGGVIISEKLRRQISNNSF